MARTTKELLGQHLVIISSSVWHVLCYMVRELMGVSRAAVLFQFDTSERDKCVCVCVCPFATL